MGCWNESISNMRRKQCCYQVVYDLLPGALYQVNVSGTSSAGSDSYSALVQFPPEYMIQGDPTSPFATIKCDKQGQNGYDCETQGNDRFFAEFTLTIPGTGAPTAANQSPQMVSPNVSLTLFGQACTQKQFCSDLVAASKNGDTVSLGFLGRWPKYVVIIVGTLAGILLLGAFYYLWKRHNPNDKHADRSDVADILNRHHGSRGGVGADPHNMSERRTTLLGPLKYDNKLALVNEQSLISKIPGTVHRTPVMDKEKSPRGLFDRTKSKSYGKERTKNKKNTYDGGNVAIEVYDEKTHGKDLGSGLSGSQIPMTSLVLDVEDSISDVSTDADNNNNFMPNTRAADVKTSRVINDLAYKGTSKSYEPPKDRDRDRREERERERREERDRRDERERDREKRDDRERGYSHDSKTLARAATTSGVKSSRGDRDYRDSRPHMRTQNLDDQREGRRGGEERNKSRKNRSTSRTRGGGDNNNTSSSRDHKTNKKKTTAELIMESANTTSLSELIRSKSAKTEKEKSSSSNNHNHNNSASQGRHTSRPNTILSSPSTKRPKKPVKKVSSDEGSSGTESSDSDNSSDQPLSDRLPLAMIASPVASAKAPQSPKNPKTTKSRGGSGNITVNKFTNQSTSLKPPEVIVSQNDSEDSSNGGGGYYESILNDVLNVGDFTGSEISNGSEEIPIGRRLQTLRDEKKKGFGGGKGSASEDDEVPIGLRMGYS
ncbi:10583_t:CDS:2 [Ambispora leptoticha]|uniref:10583_t:CDS:1 n=1 Tax=Ambispora leptoticha TaxID=144679 RepID=A0A9N9AWZ6_9GLOM|nr:10583_t:CDS:2 [Ambispora leptoticha]